MTQGSPMSDNRLSLRELRYPFIPGRAVLRMFEPLEEGRLLLFRQLFAGTYPKPFLIENGAERSLEFTLEGGSQSVMRIEDPDELVLPYTRRMMAFLLLQPDPRHIVVAGLGGGSLVK